MLLQVHDELIFEVPDSQVKEFSAQARRAMEGAVKLDVPLIVDVKVGSDWRDMEVLTS